MFAIDIQELCFAYEEREVLHNVNLQIPERDFAIIVGPNGGGKTTLLKLMLGLLQPRYGEIRIFGGQPARERQQIGYVPQSFRFDPQFPVTVLELVLMGRIERHVCGGYNRQDREIALGALADVGLADAAQKPYAALSGGQRQRVLIAQAIASQPKILMLDEPGANLDTPGVHTIYQLLQKLNQQLTIIMVSHNLSLVTSFAKHVICVNHTADMHAINEVSEPALAAGNWVHIFHHDDCPVAYGSDHEITSPHQATLHAHSRL